MTETQKACLTHLRDHRDGCDAAGGVGAALWPDRTGAINSSNGGGDYKAQMYLGRLRKKGWVRVRYEGLYDAGSSNWELTPAGRAALESETSQRRGHK